MTTPVSDHSTAKKTFGLFVAAIAWFSVILQFYLRTGSASNFFSFFTIQCNLLIALSLTFSILAPQSKPGIFFSKLSVQSSIALYIFIVALVYNTVLRGLIELHGTDYFVDNMLHVIDPVLYILFWLFFRTKGTLKWQDGIYWLFFPAAYLVYSLIRGSLIGWYPYPFLDAAELGYSQVAVNVAIMIVTFLVSGLAVIFITRKIKEKTA